MQITRGTMLDKCRFSDLNPMPASTLSLSQGLWIWPLASSDHGVFRIVFVGDGGRGFRYRIYFIAEISLMVLESGSAGTFPRWNYQSYKKKIILYFHFYVSNIPSIFFPIWGTFHPSSLDTCSGSKEPPKPM
jgi:hypothetical protein